LDRGGPRGGVDRELAKLREVEEHASFTERGTAPAVTGGAHGDLQGAGARERDGGNDILLGGGPDDQFRRPRRLQPAPQRAPSGRLVVLIAAPGDRAVEACKRFRSAHGWPAQDRRERPRAVTAGIGRR